jgi:hypothetical protein
MKIFPAMVNLVRDIPAVLVVLVDFVLYKIPCGLFTPGSFYPVVFANFLVLKDLAKWPDFHFSRIFCRLLTNEGWH